MRTTSFNSAMTIDKFSINYDYLCPFARNLNEHVAQAITQGAPFEVEFVPFNLSQVHVEDGDPPIWEDPDKAADLVANEVGYIVSQLIPDRFLDVHIGLFALRHDEGKSLKNRDEIAKVLVAQGVDESEIFAALDEHRYSERVRDLHEEQVQKLQIFGVPTVFDGERAAFVRIMKRPTQSQEDSVTVLSRILDQVFNHAELNEIKHTHLDR